MKDGKFQAEDIYLLLAERFSDRRQWLCAREVANTTGGGDRRLDFVACNCYFSEGFGIHAFEVKISKSDLRRELMDPDKHNTFFADVDYYSIVAPDYVLGKEYCALIPKQWGIYRATSGKGLAPNSLKVLRKPLALHDERYRTIRRGFAFSLIRAMGDIAARQDQGRLNEMLKASFDAGFSKGKANSYGVDYENLYHEAREKYGASLRALSILGINYWNGNDGVVEKAREIQKKNTENANVAMAIRSLGYSAEQMKSAIKNYEKVIAPILETAQKATERQEKGEGA